MQSHFYTTGLYNNVFYGDPLWVDTSILGHRFGNIYFISYSP